MTNEPDAGAQLAVVSSQIKDLREDFDRLRLELRERDHTFVSRAEFEAWRTGIGRELGDIKANAARRTAPWWSVATVLVAVAALLVTTIPLIAS